MLTREEQEAIIKAAEAMRDKEVERSRKFMMGRICFDTYERARRQDRQEIAELLKEVG